MRSIEQDKRIDDLYDYYWFNQGLAYLRSIEASIINIELIKLDIVSRINSLEIGVGNAVFSKALGFHFDIGVDISENQLDRAALADMHRTLLNIDIASELSDEDKLNLESEFIIINSVLEHVSNINQALDNIEEILLPGGYVVVTVPLLSSLDVVQNEHLSVSEIEENERISRRYLEHKNLFKEEEWKNMFTSRGLNILVSKSYLFSSSTEYIQATSFFKAVLNNRLHGENDRIIEVHKKCLSSYNRKKDQILLESELEDYNQQSKLGTCLILVLRK